MAGLISINLDGDVDTIYDASDLGSKCELYAIQDGYAVFKTASEFKKARIASSYPIAAGIDPVNISETESESETAGTGSTAGTAEQPHGSSSAETAAPPEESASVSNAPDSIINDHKAEKKGPGTA